MAPRLASPAPIASGSHASQHERRSSTHSNPVSYAYGAPPIPSPNDSPVSIGRSIRRNNTHTDDDARSTTTSHHHRRAQSLLRGEMDLHHEPPEVGDDQETSYGDEEDRLAREQSIGRAIEPASVRYARVAERKRNTGSAIRPTTPGRGVAASRVKGATDLNNTSVNIATAFAAAVKGAASGAEGVMKVGGKRGALSQQQRQDEEQQGQDGEEEAEGSGKETHKAGGAAGTDGSKKRKKRTSKDPAFKHRPGETTSEEDLSEELRSKAKRSKKGSTAEAEQVTAASSGKKVSPNSRRKATDASYRPTGDSEATSDDELSDEAQRRQKSKGKGRASTGSMSNAIPIGRRDNEVWQKTKKRKGRKGRRAVTGEQDDEDEDDEESDSDEDPEGESGDMGSIDDHFLLDDSVEPPSVSFFLRNKSPTPERGSEAPTSKGFAVTVTPQLKNGGYPTSSPGTHSPFQPLRAFTFGFGSRASAPAPAPAPAIDPSFDEFDRTIGAAGHSFNRSVSVDDSIIRGSSYDYSEEERIVAALEEQRRQNLLANKQKAGGDGVNGLTAGLRRRNRLPGPPGLAGIQEETQDERRDGVGAMLGRLVHRLLARVWKSMQDPLLDWGKIWRAIGLGLLGLLALAYLLPSTSLESPSNSGIPSEHPSIIHYVPFFRPSTTYRAPTVPADSLEELIARLTSLEGAMGQLTSLSDSDRARTKADHQALAKMTDQLSSLEQTLSNERQTAAKALESNVKANTKQNRELEQSLKGARADLDALVARVHTIQDAHSTDAADLRKLKASIDATTKEIASLGTKVAQVTNDVRKGLDGERMAKIALEAIEQRLPPKMAVKVDEHGKVEVDATFWKHLRDAFVDKKAVETIVIGKVAQELAKLPLKTERDIPAQVVIHGPAKWDEFLEANEASLRALIASDIEGRSGSDAIVTRKAFLDTLRREIKTLKSDFEAKANENVEKIGQELLRKVAKQDEMKRKESGGGLASHLHLPFTGHKGDSTASGAALNDSMAVLMSSLVDSALLRYSKDVLARPDYALFTAGGRVVRSLTSSTYEANPLGPGRKALAWLSGNVAPRGRPPVTALHPDKSPGSCWPFRGTHGQLGIQLSRSIVPSDVTIEHVSIDVALDGEVASAPREFEVWGVVESRSDIERLARYRHEQLETRREAASQGVEGEHEIDPPTSIPPTPNHILVAIGSYDTTSPTPIQTFPVTPMARQLGIPVQVVVLKVLSNHGESAYTCLYRVRVSGTSTTTVKQ